MDMRRVLVSFFPVSCPNANQWTSRFSVGLKEEKDDWLEQGTRNPWRANQFELGAAKPLWNVPRGYVNGEQYGESMLYITTACLSLRSYPFSPLSPAIQLSQQWQHQPTTSAQFKPPSPLLLTHPQPGPTLRQFVLNITPSPLVSILIILKYIISIFCSNIMSNTITTTTRSTSSSICKRGNPLRPYQEVVLFQVLLVLEGDAEQGPSAWHPLRPLLLRLTWNLTHSPTNLY